MDKKILLIDSDKFILRIFKYKLSKQGFNVYTAEDGPSGVRMIKKIRPDLILLEIILQPPNGFEILRKFGKRFKFIVVSTLQNKNDIKLAKDLNAKEFINKEGIPTNAILNLAVQYLR